MNAVTDIDLATCKKDVLCVLYYYAYFHFPLIDEEVQGNCSQLCSLHSVKKILKDLQKSNQVFQHDNYFALTEDIETWVLKRRQGQQLAMKKIKQALSVGRFIYGFPFVKFVGISGSLSKGYIKPDGDFDFFIITDEKRLWICRTFLHLFKKLSFLFGQQHKFCMNYFLDCSHPVIEEQNNFTAIEIRSMIPVAGQEEYLSFLHSNRWTDTFLPNGYKSFYRPDVVMSKNNLMKKLFKKIHSPWMEKLNQWLMKITDKRWRKKWEKKKFSMSEYDLAFKTTLYHSKNHPSNYQQRMLDRMENFKNKI